MRVFGWSGLRGAWLTRGLLAAAVLGGGTSAWSVETTAPVPKGSAAVPASVALTSPGLWDVIRLENAKVDPEVIKAFIKNSSVAYNPSPSEIIALKDRGVPPDVIAALLQRGGELRAQAGPSPAMPPYPAGGTPSSAPPYPNDYTDYGQYPADYSMDAYANGYPWWWWSSYWPGYWGGWGGWPWWWGGFDSFGHHHHFRDFDRFHHVNHFDHFNHFNHAGMARFQNDDFNRFPFARFQNHDFNRFSRARFQNFDFNSQAALNARVLSPAPAAFGSFRSAPGAFAPRGSFAPAAFVRGGAFNARSMMAARGGMGVRGGMAMGARGGGGHGGGGGGHR